MRPLNHPSPCLESRILFPLHFFLPTRFDVRLVVSMLKKIANVFRVVAFIEADMLMPMRGGLRSVNWGTVKSSLQQLDVVRVSTTHLHTQRHTTSVGEYRSLGAQFTTIGRVFSCIFPHPEAIWSSLRPRFANSIGCLLARHTPRARLSTACETRPLQSIAGSSGVKYFLIRIHGEPLSTARQYATHRRCLERPFSDRPEGDPLSRWNDSVAAKAASAATVLQGDAKRNVISVSLPLRTPPCWQMSDDLLYGSAAATVQL
jgi:hypothetical protein